MWLGRSSSQARARLRRDELISCATLHLDKGWTQYCARPPSLQSLMCNSLRTPTLSAAATQNRHLYHWACRSGNENGRMLHDARRRDDRRDVCDAEQEHTGRIDCPTGLVSAWRLAVRPPSTAMQGLTAKVLHIPVKCPEGPLIRTD